MLDLVRFVKITKLEVFWGIKLWILRFFVATFYRFPYNYKLNIGLKIV